jgi:hypothetical protein
VFACTDFTYTSQEDIMRRFLEEIGANRVVLALSAARMSDGGFRNCMRSTHTTRGNIMSDNYFRRLRKGDFSAILYENKRKASEAWRK